MQHTYAFEVKLAAVVRIDAASEREAREKLSNGTDGTGWSVDGALFDVDRSIVLTDWNVDDVDPYLFRIDDEDTQ